MKIGIGIATYNRQKACSDLAYGVKRTNPDAIVCVSDDGSDEPINNLPEDIIYLRNKNGGIARNKNRLLYRLFEIEECDVVLILEDDLEIIHEDWSFPFVKLAQTVGHTNIIFPDMDIIPCGYGYASGHLAGAVMAVYRDAFLSTGYLDPRFGKYGFEHVEYTQRMIRNGFGGSRFPDGSYVYSGWPMTGVVSVSSIPTTVPDGFKNSEHEIYQLTLNDIGFKFPWCSGSERESFIGECK